MLRRIEDVYDFSAGDVETAYIGQHAGGVGRWAADDDLAACPDLDGLAQRRVGEQSVQTGGQIGRGDVARAVTDAKEAGVTNRERIGASPRILALFRASAKVITCSTSLPVRLTVVSWAFARAWCSSDQSSASVIGPGNRNVARGPALRAEDVLRVHDRHRQLGRGEIDHAAVPSGRRA